MTETLKKPSTTTRLLGWCGVLGPLTFVVAFTAAGPLAGVVTSRSLAGIRGGPPR
jgi:hypothetical protein